MLAEKLDAILLNCNRLYVSDEGKGFYGYYNQQNGTLHFQNLDEALHLSFRIDDMVDNISICLEGKDISTNVYYYIYPLKVTFPEI